MGLPLRHDMALSASRPTDALTALIARIGGEMAMLADRVTILQTLVELPEEVDPTPAHVEAVQSLDLVDQTLRALADVMTRTTVGLETSGDVDVEHVLAGCPLSDLSRRLAGLPPAPSAEDLELF